MDKSNRKFKILYKYIKANTSAIWQHRLHIPPTKVLKEFREQVVRKLGQEQKRRQDGKSDTTKGRRTREEI